MNTSHRKNIGKRFMVGFHGTGLTDEIRTLLGEMKPAGIILSDKNKNFKSPEQFSELIAQVIEVTENPQLMVAVDQEGGGVLHIPPPFTRFPSAKTLGDAAIKAKNPALVFEFGKLLASELAAVGINCPLSPVLDIRSEPKNEYMGNRALSTKASQVALLGAELVKGILSQNLMACAKHFPGHGDTLADSHHTLPVLLHHQDFLEKRELIPFAQAIAAGVPMIMIAHLLFPYVDESNPTSLSAVFLQTILRKKMGFTGICIVDDLNMDAVARDFPLEEIVRLGNPLWDLFLFCENQDRQMKAFELLAKEVELTGTKAHDASVTRIQKTAAQFCPSPRFALSDLPQRLGESERFLTREFSHLME